MHLNPIIDIEQQIAQRDIIEPLEVYYIYCVYSY